MSPRRKALGARHICATLLVMVFACLAIPSFATAAFGLKSTDVYSAEADGTPALEAGSHPYSLATTIEFNTLVDGEGREVPDGSIKDLETDLPLGLAGIPKATPRCSGADFANIDKNVDPPIPACADDTAIGFVTAAADFHSVPPGGAVDAGFPLYNLVPAPGSAAKLGFVVAGVPITIDAGLSEEPPYRVVARLRNSSQAVLIFRASVAVWGYPASPVHDPVRGSCLAGVDSEGVPQSNGKECPVGAEVPKIPFLTLPRACTGPLTSLFRGSPWEFPSVVATSSSVTHDDGEPPNPRGFENCDELEFEPTIEADVSSTSASSPTGLDFSLDVDDEGITSPTEKAQSDIKRVVATLPEGVTVNPSAATGLSGCTTAQYENETLHSAPGEGCPEASKVGTVSVETPLVDELISGSLFVAAPDDPATSAPGVENPFNSFLAIYMVLRNENLGVIIRQAGKIEADPITGQLTTVFDDVPQFPIGHLEAHFREGPRAPLVTPGTCGTFVAEAEQTPWANPTEPLLTVADFEISSGPNGGPCPVGPAPLAPHLEAGTANSTAGAYSPFNLRVTRQDGEAELTRLSVTMPPGLTGKLAGIGKCSDAAIEGARAKTGLEERAAPSCPATSEIGDVVAGAGVGSSLTYAAGKVYLAGPYAGDPFSLVVITPAVAGPFDAGNVVIRDGLEVDSTTAQVRVDGGGTPLPTILKGIPLRLRDLRVSVDRDNFTLNPTSCEPFSITASASGSGLLIGSTTVTIAEMATRFQASGCGALKFKPKLSFSLTGATKRTGHPVLRAELKPRPGDANLGRIATILPPSQFIDPLRVASPCTRVKFNANECPPASVLGHARAFTPLLDQPLEGPVYFRSNGGERELPDVVADLKGEVRFTLVGFVDAVTHKGSEVSRVRTIFQGTPDAPVSKVVLLLKGGKEGLLQNSRNLCAQPQRLEVRMRGHNGITKNFRQTIKTSCRKKR